MTPTGHFMSTYCAPSASRQAARLEAAANRALHAHGYPELWNLHLEIDGRRLVLYGAVSTYYLKQLAQTTLMALDEVAQVTNRVVVRTPANIRDEGPRI